ncbi:MAG TPA: hypothetical protein VFP65_27140 [Anaeromyxobacteraceae bacterium]|nr:hypothetical protein [Anaeromyxobacteraceae bacterium]
MDARHAIAALVAATCACGSSRSSAGAAGDGAACIAGRLVTADGASPSGARVALDLETRPNPDASQSITSGSVGVPTAAGDVCAEISWSGATAPAVSIVVGHAEQAYRFGPFQTAAAVPGGSRCGSGGCADLGVLALTEDRRLPVSVCEVSGVVEDGNGGPLANAIVSASDASVPSSAAGVLCFPEPSLCHAGALSDAAGRFTLRTLVADGPSLQAWRLDTSDPIFDRMRSAESRIRGCPSAPVTLTADAGFDAVRNVVVTLSGLEITWSGGYLAANVRVYRGDVTRWAVAATSGGFAGPVTYGRVPAGSEQRSPPGLLAPPPLASGDEISVLVSGTAPDGFPLTGSGSLVVP